MLDDADLDKAVKHAVSGRMGNSGQACTASKRIIVVEALADRFLEKFQAAMEGFKPGDPMDKQTTLAPLSSAQALEDAPRARWTRPSATARACCSAASASRARPAPSCSRPS